MQIQPPPVWLPEQNTKSFAGSEARSEERAQGLSNAKGSNLPSAKRSLPQARHGINGDPELVEGEDAVYAGFDLEQA